MYQLTSLGLTKMLVFHIIRRFLWYTIENGMIDSLLIILLIDEAFPIVSQMTQIEIVCKSYTTKKLS